MTSFSASKPSISTAAVGITLGLAAASMAPVQAAVITTRDTRPGSLTLHQFRGTRSTLARVESPLNGLFSVMQERWTPEQSGGIATFSFDTTVVHNGIQINSPLSFTRGFLMNEPLPMVFHIWKKDEFNPSDLSRGLVSSQITGRTSPDPIQSGTVFSNPLEPVFRMTYGFNIPQINSAADFLVGFGRISSDTNRNYFGTQLASQRPNLLINSSPDYVINSLNSTGPSGTFIEQVAVGATSAPFISSKLVITTVPEPTAASVLAFATMPLLARRARRE